MYCGSCLQGNTLVVALRKRGEDALSAPLYLPLRTDEENASLPRIFFGGINVYFQERCLFRHTPWFFDRLLDHPALLRRIARKRRRLAGTPRGADGLDAPRRDRPAAERTRQAGPLAPDGRPPGRGPSEQRALLGTSGEIQRQLGVPVICSVGGEDRFIEQLHEPHSLQVRHCLASERPRPPPWSP